MSNPYYSNTGYPQFRAPGKSEDMRAELKRIEGGLDRLPDPIMPNQPVFGNASGTGMVMKDKDAAKALLDLDKVDNTSDADKPISTATAAEIANIQADVASTQADLASTQADVANTQADVANTQADVANIQADVANIQADVALLPTVSDLNIAGNVINGDFQVAQEGATHNTQGYGSIDGVFLNRVGSGLSVSQESFTLGQTDVPGEPVNYARFTVNSVAGANNFAACQLRIPDVRNYAGGKCFVAFDAKADVAGKTIGVRLDQNFGTGGSATVLTPVQIKTLSNAWTGDWHVFEFDVPSIAGKIIGTGENDYIAVIITFDAGSSYSEYTAVGQKSGIYDVCKLRVVRNLWELNHYRQSLSDALDDCYQYYQVITATGVANGFSYMNGAFSPVRGFSFTFKRRMRAIPVATYTGYNTVGCALDSIACTDQQGVVNVNLTAPGNYVITGGTIRLDARI